MRRRLVVTGAAVLALLVLAGCVFLINVRPVARFTAVPTSGTSPLDVDFDATASYDPDGTIVEYWWDFGDGQTASAVVILTHRYAAPTDPEVFTVVLTVTDDDGASDTAVRNVSVTP